MAREGIKLTEVVGYGRVPWGFPRGVRLRILLMLLRNLLMIEPSH
jgi:hypothetical protein